MTNKREVDANKESLIGGLPLSEWNKRWEPVAGGFLGNYNIFRHQNGVFRARLNGETKYIGTGANRRSGGLSGRITQILRNKSSGANHHGAIKIREFCKELDLDVIILGRDEASISIAKALGRKLLRPPKPEWNVQQKVKPAKAE